VNKGEQTRKAILEAAFDQATQLGLEGLTIGKLAEQLGMSKSGVFAHFRSREDLQLAVLELAGQRFVAQVLQPALSQPRGLARLRAIGANWFSLHQQSRRACLFISASTEYDDRPGPLRDAVKASHQRWRQDLARCVQQAIDKGQLHEDADPEQIAFELFALVLGLHHDARLFDDDGARQRATRALDNLLNQYKVEVAK
jgi:AcrR family transcriptional regulator